MGIKTVFKSKIQGEIHAPSSKSVMQRAVALAFLARGRSIIRKPSESSDGLAAIELVSSLGVQTDRIGDHLVLDSPGTIVDTGPYYLSCGESGLGMRMFSPILALFENPVVLKGEGSLRNRTVDMIERDLNRMGVFCRSQNGRPPIEIKGPMVGGELMIDGSISSQFLTGLLIALPRCPRDSKITVRNLTSKPYVELTLQMLAQAGIRIEVDWESNCFKIAGGQNYAPLDLTVEGDWSGAAFLLGAGALGGEISVRNLSVQSCQADRAFLELLERAGATVVNHSDSITVNGKDLHAFEFDVSECPDLFPPIAALAARVKGKSTVFGTERLQYKESNRGKAIREEFKKLGIRVDLFQNHIDIYGGSVIGGKTDAHNDHRIAMALALIGLNAPDGVEINGAESVFKSYAGFFDDLKQVGGDVR